MEEGSVLIRKLFVFHFSQSWSQGKPAVTMASKAHTFACVPGQNCRTHQNLGLTCPKCYKDFKESLVIRTSDLSNFELLSLSNVIHTY